MMTANELRRKYIEFFKANGHAEIKSASLIPDNDPTCLFTTAGMHPLVPYLQGAKHPAGDALDRPLSSYNNASERAIMIAGARTRPVYPCFDDLIGGGATTE